METGAEWFAKQKPEIQDLILGKAAGAAFREGKVRLADFVGERRTRKWGTTRYTLSLKEARERATNRERMPGSPVAASRAVGNTVKHSFTVQEADRPFVEHLFNAIDTVHGVTSIAALQIDRRSLPHGWDGQFDPDTRTATISPDATFPLSTGAHEVGHAMDAVFLVSASKLGRLDGPITLYASQYAAEERGILVDWLDAVLKSPLVAELQRIRRTFSFMSPEWNEVAYVLEPTELWARSYEQFIGTNTRDADLRSQFQQKRQEPLQIADLKFGVYWTPEEFHSIERAIKRVLESLGWM